METKEIQTVENVRAYIDENGVAQLNVEDIAVGLGFTQIKNGVRYVRWETVNGYLAVFGFSQQVGKDDYIPENFFYRLAMKASNDTAEKFQSKVADEVIPQIRKTGMYSAKSMTQTELIAAMAQNAVQIEKTAKKALQLAEEANEKMDKTVEKMDNIVRLFADAGEKDWKQKVNDDVRRVCQEKGLCYMAEYGDMYKQLETKAGVDIERRLENLRKRFIQQGHSKTEAGRITKLEVIYRDSKLREIFNGILKTWQARFIS